jgi:uncharacterized protein YqgV (UPF0045/DUF77 family)
VVQLEFTIEPFIEGRPGVHVTAAVAAAEALGVEVEFGPFGTTCRVPAGQAAEVCRAVVEAALSNGATHVAMHLERSEPSPPMATGSPSA